MKSNITDNPILPASPVIYADSLSNKGGTGIYLKRLLEGFIKCHSQVRAAVGRELITPSEALAAHEYEGGIRKVFNEYFILPSVTASYSPSIIHLPAFSGRTPPGIPFAVTVHDLAFIRNHSWFPFLRSIYYRLHFRKVAGKADAVMVDSEFTGLEAEKYLGIESDKIRKVYLSTDSFRSDPAVFRKAFHIEGRYIVAAGTIEPRKNITALLDSWETVRKIHTDIRLVIAGRWGWGPRALKKRLLEAEGTVLTGPISDNMLKSCISGALLLVYPSLYEGFGLPPLEAASAGVPSVLTPASALREIYSGVSTIADGFDSSSITQSILDSIETEHDAAALMDFAAGFSTQRMAQNVMNVYSEFGT